MKNHLVFLQNEITHCLDWKSCLETCMSVLEVDWGSFTHWSLGFQEVFQECNFDLVHIWFLWNYFGWNTKLYPEFEPAFCSHNFILISICLGGRCSYASGYGRNRSGELDSERILLCAQESRRLSYFSDWVMDKVEKHWSVE